MIVVSRFPDFGNKFTICCVQESFRNGPPVSSMIKVVQNYVEQNCEKKPVDFFVFPEFFLTGKPVCHL